MDIDMLYDDLKDAPGWILRAFKEDYEYFLKGADRSRKLKVLKRIFTERDIPYEKIPV